MRVRLFGQWNDKPADAAEGDAFDERTRLMLAWLGGEPVELTPALVAMLREEFIAQERFRETLVRHFASFAEGLSHAATVKQDALELPADPAQQFDAGYRAGAYVSLTSAAQAARKALTEATAEVVL